MKITTWLALGLQLVAIGITLYLAYWPMAYISLDDDYWAPLISLHPIGWHITDVFYAYWGCLLIVLLLVLWALHVGRFQPTLTQRGIAFGGAGLIALTIAYEPNQYLDGFYHIYGLIRFHQFPILSLIFVCIELLLIFSLLITYGGLPQYKPRDQSGPVNSMQGKIIYIGLFSFFVLGPVIACLLPPRENYSPESFVILFGAHTVLFTSIALFANRSRR